MEDKEAIYDELEKTAAPSAQQGETNAQLDTDSNSSAPGQQRDVDGTVALGQPVGHGSDSTAGDPSAQGDKLLTVAERNIRSFLRSATFKSESDREAALNCVDVLSAAPRAAPQPAVQQGNDFWPVDGNASRKQLIKQIGRMNYQLTALRQENAGLVARVQRQAEALRNLQSAAAPAAQEDALDTVRLNWLEGVEGRFYNIDRISAVVGTGFLTRTENGTAQISPTLRAAIDAASAATPNAAPAPAAVAEPVAWLHDDPQRYDVIHAEVKDLLVKSRDAAGHLHRPLDKSAHYTIPLYAAPAPAAQGAAAK